MVQSRAAEIARINGRAGTVLDQDRDEALKELTGAEVTNEDPDTSTIINRTQDWDDNAATKGKIIAAVPPSDEQTDAERLTQQGIDEAEHETMLEGLKIAKNQE
ncbi:MAG: hypothetical protein JWN25_2131 [Verrucomicrobiales bacterium]|nr:hypothetical protein [Verrucomicrobiales bacterium]